MVRPSRFRPPCRDPCPGARGSPRMRWRCSGAGRGDPAPDRTTDGHPCDRLPGGPPLRRASGRRPGPMGGQKSGVGKTGTRSRNRSYSRIVSGASGRALVVDDNRVIRQLIRVNLELEGFEVVTAADGAECLEVVREVRPDVITLDVVMPRLDGLRTAARLRADPRTSGLPIAIISACTPYEVESGLTAGVDAFLAETLRAVRPDRAGAATGRHGRRDTRRDPQWRRARGKGQELTPGGVRGSSLTPPHR